MELFKKTLENLGAVQVWHQQYLDHFRPPPPVRKRQKLDNPSPLKSTYAFAIKINKFMTIAKLYKAKHAILLISKGNNIEILQNWSHWRQYHLINQSIIYQSCIYFNILSDYPTNIHIYRAPIELKIPNLSLKGGPKKLFSFQILFIVLEVLLIIIVCPFILLKWNSWK